MRHDMISTGIIIISTILAVTEAEDTKLKGIKPNKW
jgi:hypothetical protein